MPVQSKIVSPISISSASDEAAYYARSRIAWSPSPLRYAQDNHHGTFMKHESGLSSGFASTHHVISRLASDSGSADHPRQRASGLASNSGSAGHPRQRVSSLASASGLVSAARLPSAPTHRSHQTPTSTSRHNYPSQLHATTFSDHGHTDSDLQILHAENKSLRRELAKLNSHFSTISYVLNIPHLFANDSYCLKRKVRRPRRKSG